MLHVRPREGVRQRPPTARLGVVLASALAALTLAAPARAADPLVAAAGDIACGKLPVTEDQCHQQATSDLLVGRPLSAVLMLGDAQYDNGELENFQQFYDPTWGRFKAITKPAVGNHEYYTTDAKGYFTYFGAAAGPPTTGWYSYDIGKWHVVVLNSSCGKVGGCYRGSPQDNWLRADLAAHPHAVHARLLAPPALLVRLGLRRQRRAESDHLFLVLALRGAAPTWCWAATTTTTSDSRRRTPRASSISPMACASSWSAPAAGRGECSPRRASTARCARDRPTACSSSRSTPLHMTGASCRSPGKTFSDAGTQKCHGDPGDPLLTLTRTARKLSSTGSLKASLSCTATCSTRTQVTVTIGRRKIRSLKVSRTLQPLERSSVRVKFGRYGHRLIRRAFRRHTRLRAEVSSRATVIGAEKTGSAKALLRLRR